MWPVLSTEHSQSGDGQLAPAAAGEGQGKPARQKDASASNQTSGAADTVLLRKMVEAGTTGMTTDDIGTILGRRGKAARRALDEWAKRIGLITDDNMDAFEFARVGTRRGWRMKSSLLDVAKHLMTQH